MKKALLIVLVLVVVGVIFLPRILPLRIEGEKVQLHKETGIYFIEIKYGDYNEHRVINPVDIKAKQLLLGAEYKDIYFDPDLNSPMARVVDDWIAMLDSRGQIVSGIYTRISRCGPEYLIGKKGYSDYPHEQYLLDLKGKVIAGPYAEIRFEDGKIYAREWWQEEQPIILKVKE